MSTTPSQDQGLRHATPTPAATICQLAGLALCVSAPILLYVYFVVAEPDYVALLTNHPLGQKIAGAAALWLALGAATQFGVGWLINARFPPADRSRRVARWIVSYLAGAAIVWLFVAPALFTVAIGPAAITISETLKETAP